MATKKKTQREPEKELTDKQAESAVNDIFDLVEEMNMDASTLSESALSNVDDFIDSGNYALNAIMSGSVYGGIPTGRVTGFFGPSATGKTLITNKIIANAQKKGYRPIYFDSEQALDKEVARRLGCDIDKVKHAPVELIEECKTQVINILTKAIEMGLKNKLIICIDSLGGLNTSKEIDDSLEGHHASDMGLRAKQLKSLINKITYRAAKSGTPVIFTNHIYTNVGDLYPSLVKKMPGGLSPLYISSLLVQLSSTDIKVSDDKGVVGKLSEKVSGIKLRAFTTKNRFVPPYLSTEMYLSFKTGLERYSGLLELAVNLGVIDRTGPTYVYGDKKLGFSKSFEHNPEFWEGEMLDAVDAALKVELQYSDETMQEIEKELKQLENLTEETINA